jgi:integrase
MPGPTLTAQACEAILEAGVRISVEQAARVALSCFSGLEIAEILALRWRDLQWCEGVSLIWQTKVRRKGRLTTLYVVGPGARALLRFGIDSLLEKNAYVLRGRDGGPLAERAYRDSLKAACRAAGWPRATRAQLASALAAWLQSRGMDDHAISRNPRAAPSCHH